MTFDKKQIPLYKRALSYIKPVWLTHQASTTNPYLEVLLYHDRIQLATRDALYSDGKYYTPALTVVKHLKAYCPQMKEVLVLGVGLGSVVDVLSSKNYHPEYTLVEKDKVVLQMAMEYLQYMEQGSFNPVVADAKVFMAANTQKFDLVFIDIFDSRTVPSFVCSMDFLLACKRSLQPGGKAALNYIINEEQQWLEMKKNFDAVFPSPTIISSDINRIFIGTA